MFTVVKTFSISDVQRERERERVGPAGQAVSPLLFFDVTFLLCSRPHHHTSPFHSPLRLACRLRWSIDCRLWPPSLARGAGAFIDAATAIKELCRAILGWGYDSGRTRGVPRAGVGRVGWRRGGAKEEKAEKRRRQRRGVATRTGPGGG